MENNYPHISINPLTDYISATESVKRRIIRDQKNANPLKVFWYTIPKNAIPKCVKKGFDYEILTKAIDRIRNSVQDTKNKKCNAKVSIEIIEKFLQLNFTSKLPDVKHLFFTKIDKKHYLLNGLQVTVTPDVVFEWFDEKGDNNLGAIKFHYGKSKQLSPITGRLRASLLYDFVKRAIAKDEDIVNSSFCICVDIYNGCIYKASKNTENDMEVIKTTCAEILENWNSA